MSNQWFRMYAEFANDSKVQMMSEQYQRRLVMLFCLRCNGDVTLHDDEVAFQLRVTAEEWSETKREFLKRGFIDNENNLLNWDKRQYVSDSSAERVRKHREKKRNGDVTTCNVTVTPPEQNRTDTEQKEILSSSEQESACATDDDFPKKELEALPEPEPPEPPVKPWHQTYHQVEFHPQFNEVVKYITDRLPKLKRTSATEVNRWLQEGVSPPDIYATVDYCISASAQPIYSFSYFSDAVLSCVRLKKELAEQGERIRKKYAESN